MNVKELLPLYTEIKNHLKTDDENEITEYIKNAVKLKIIEDSQDLCLICGSVMSFASEACSPKCISLLRQNNNIRNYKKDNYEF